MAVRSIEKNAFRPNGHNFPLVDRQNVRYHVNMHVHVVLIHTVKRMKVAQ